MGRPRIHNHVPKRFGRLTVIHEVDGTRYSRRFKCECDCGSLVTVTLNRLLSGNTKSCGCLKREVAALRSTTHGLSKTPIYSVWRAMKDRCLNPNDRAYKNYGERGIKICDEWKDSFERFYSWALNSGYIKGLTIERKDNDGPYSPENCTWIPRREQSKNRRNSRWISFRGERKTVAGWSKYFGINRKTLIDRLDHGWDIESALTIQPNKKYRGGQP